jgi:hypothetical protein
MASVLDGKEFLNFQGCTKANLFSRCGVVVLQRNGETKNGFAHKQTQTAAYFVSGL